MCRLEMWVDATTGLMQQLTVEEQAATRAATEQAWARSAHEDDAAAFSNVWLATASWCNDLLPEIQGRLEAFFESLDKVSFCKHRG